MKTKHKTNESISSSAPTALLRVVRKAVLDLLVHGRGTAVQFVAILGSHMVHHWKDCIIHLSAIVENRNSSRLCDIEAEHLDDY